MSESLENIPPPLHEDHEANPTELDPLLRSGLRRGQVTKKGDTAAALIASFSILAIATFTWVLVLTHHPRALSYFAYHPTLQTAAIVCLIFGIMSPQRTTLDDPEGRSKGLVYHQYFNAILGFPLITAGTAIMYYNKYSHGAPHFTTWHAKFGILTYSLIVVQALIGGASVWFGGAAFGGGDKAKRIYKYHRISGYLILTLMLVTIHLSGAWADWVVMNTTQVQRAIVYTTLPALVWLGIGWRIRPGKMKFW